MRNIWRSPNPFSELTYEETRLRRLPSTIGRVYSEVLSRPGQQLVLGSLFLLFGFYLAGSLSTIIGASRRGRRSIPSPL